MFFYLCLKFSVLSFLLFNLFKLFFCKCRAPSSPVSKNDAIKLFMVVRGYISGLFPVLRGHGSEFRAVIAFIRLNNIN